SARVADRATQRCAGINGYLRLRSGLAGRARAAARMELLWDEGTFALLERLGVGPGSRVAEVGAGGGSVVEWLAERVGESGRVLAVAVFLRYLEPLAGARGDRGA